MENKKCWQFLAKRMVKQWYTTALNRKDFGIHGQNHHCTVREVQEYIQKNIPLTWNMRGVIHVK